MKKMCVTLTILLFFSSNASFSAGCGYESCWDTRELPDFWYGTPEQEEVATYLDRERAFSKYSWKYALASALVYERELTEEPFPNESQFNWISMGSIPEKDKKIGFSANAWYVRNNSGNEIVISFRGTDSFWADFFKGNFVFAPYIFGRTQFDAALDFTHEILNEAEVSEKPYSRIVLTGHSLGGGLAQYVQRLTPEVEAIVFDPSPNKGRAYSLFRTKYPEHSTRVYEKGEILEYPRKLIDGDYKWDWEPGKIGKNTIWMDFYIDGALEGHGIRDLAMSLLKVAMVDGDSEAEFVFDAIISERNEEIE